MTAIIDNFRAEYYFLSNFYHYPITFIGIEYPTSEHAFQAQKSLDEKEQLFISVLKEPGQAKKEGRHLTLRPDWEAIKLMAMKEIIETKFAPGTHLAEKLINTFPAKLIEGNYWNDRFWGQCGGVGENHLGVILMNHRQKLIMQEAKDRAW